MSIEFSGLDDILNSLDELADKQQLKKALKKSCALVERSAKQKAPKGDGDLRRSIKSKIEEDSESVRGVVYTPLMYAPYVEYGTGLFAEGGNGRKDVPWGFKDEKTGETIWTKGQKPIPYMRPALDENREQILSILKERLAK